MKDFTQIREAEGHRETQDGHARTSEQQTMDPAPTDILALKTTDLTSDAQEVDDKALPDKEEPTLHGLQQQFEALDSKFKFVNTVFGPQLDSIAPNEGDSKKYTTLFYTASLQGMSREGLDFEHQRHTRFFNDAARLLGNLQEAFENLGAVRRAMKEHEDKAINSRKRIINMTESPTAKHLSTNVILQGQRAIAIAVDWETIISPRTNLEDSILMPIEVVCSDPGPAMFKSLRETSNHEVRGSPQADNVQEYNASVQSPDRTGHRGLPERIKILSSPLSAILVETGSDTTVFGKDDSTMMMRPYKHLINHEQRLRDKLSRLETSFAHLTQSSHQVEISTTLGSPSASTVSAIQIVESSMENAGHRSATLAGTGEKEQGAESKPILTTKHDGEHDGEENDEVPKEEFGSQSVTALLHLRCLMKFFDDIIKPRLDWIGSADCKAILFSDLWHFYKPGDKVVDQMESQAWTIVRVATPRHKVEDPWVRWYNRSIRSTRSDGEIVEADDEVAVTLHCAYIDFDGKQFGPVSMKFKIPEFTGVKEVRSLPLYPFRYAKDSDLRNSLIRRAKMLLDVTNFKPMYYAGPTLETGEEIDSQVVIDCNEALSHSEQRHFWQPAIKPITTVMEGKPDEDETCNALCCEGQAVYDDSWIDQTLSRNFVTEQISRGVPSLILSPMPLKEMEGAEQWLSDDEFVVMTYRVFGFVLRSRKWAMLDLTHLRYENADARASSIDAFERLELPDGHAQMVRSLVTQHFRSRKTSLNKEEQTDLIRGKGKGLIILLHGAPGVGKTTTAEGIAEKFKRPLFQITCGDLGTTAQQVEAQLEKNFALASRWGCILLLDEADVFLAARERKDFIRNGLVSVFLRVLEYYTGVLFLTTNRIGDFDEAFASRIHMSLYYPELDEEKTVNVFKLNLDLTQKRFKQQNREIIFDTSTIEYFAQQHYRQHSSSRWNGRQIRNLCQTALALAEFEAQADDEETDTTEVDKSKTVNLQLKHFQTVQNAYLGFGQYLGDIRGTQGDQRASDYGLRARQQDPKKPSQFSQRADQTRPSRESQHWSGHRPRMPSSDGSQYHQQTPSPGFQPIHQAYSQSSHAIQTPQQVPVYQQYAQQQYPSQQAQQLGQSMGQGFRSPGPAPGQMGMSQPPVVDSRIDQFQQGSQMIPQQYINAAFQGSPNAQTQPQGAQVPGPISQGVPPQ